MAMSSSNRYIAGALEDRGYGQGVSSPSLYAVMLGVGADLPGMNAQRKTRDTVRPGLGAREEQSYQERVPLNWGCEAVGSGDVATPPVFDMMFQAAGWSRIQRTGTATVQAAPIAVGTPTGGWSYVVATGYTGYNRRRVTVTCTTAGASGAAQATIAAPATGLGETAEAAYEAAGVTITDGTAITLPGGAEITPTMTADWDVDDQWVIELTPPGIEYWPSSDRQSFASAAFKYNVDGVLFQALGARFQLSADWQAEGWPLISFKGAGLYAPPTAEALPDLDYSHIREPEVIDAYSAQVFIEPMDRSEPPWMPVLKSFRSTGGADARSKSRVNLDTVEVGDHVTTGDLVVEMEHPDQRDVFAMAGRKYRVWMTVGTGLGERCEILMPAYQVGNITLSDDQGDVLATLPGRAVSPKGAGDDEVCFRFF